MPTHKLITKALQRYWRLTRGLRLDVAVLAQNVDGHVLLVRGRPDGTWRLPGGQVRKGETAAAALARCLHHDCGLELADPPRLHTIHTGGGGYGHTVLYLIGAHGDALSPPPAFEAAFYPLDRLPHDLAAGAGERLRSMLQPRAASHLC